jgi:D-glucosaminate-6-phosphate ammonia-lyase
MSVYDRFGVKTVINAAGAMTRYGGTMVDEEVLDAMKEAAGYFVRMDELQAAASKIISQRTHSEAGIVTAGAAAALTLGTAACLAGLDVARMNRLPDTLGCPDEVLMPWHQISGYEHAIRAAGAKVIGVGIPGDVTPPDQVYRATKRDVESMVTGRTAAIACAVQKDCHPSIEELVYIGKKYNLPVILDASDQLPPVSNLYKWTDTGATLVCFSGGKGIRGPQASGILCGRRDLISSAVLQMLDTAGEPFDEWEPPRSLIPKEKLNGKPLHGIGRGMKVAKEALIGLLVALENFTEEKYAAQEIDLKALIESIATRIRGLAGIALENNGGYFKGGHPGLKISINAEKTGKSAVDVFEELKNGDPSILLGDRDVKQGILLLNSINMDKEMANLVGERLYRVLKNK